MGILTADRQPDAVPTIKDYLDEEVTLKLTRREIYWLRKQNSRRVEAALQGMNAPASSPAKRAGRYEEYKFHRELAARLHGIYDEEGELTQERDDELKDLIDKYEKQARQMTDFAKNLRERYGHL